MQYGKSKNFGIGGGASVLAGPDGIAAIAPNGGIGIGSAVGGTQVRPFLAITLWFDNDVNLRDLGPQAIKSKYDFRG